MEVEILRGFLWSARLQLAEDSWEDTAGPFEPSRLGACSFGLCASFRPPSKCPLDSYSQKLWMSSASPTGYM